MDGITVYDYDYAPTEDTVLVARAHYGFVRTVRNMMSDGINKLVYELVDGKSRKADRTNGPRIKIKRSPNSQRARCL